MGALALDVHLPAHRHDRTAEGGAQLVGERRRVVALQHDDVAPDGGLERVGIARGHDPALVEDQDAVGALRLLALVGRVQHRRPLLGGGGQRRPQVGPRRRVQAAGGLVEQQHLGAGQQRARQLQAPRQAAGEGRDAVAPPVRQPGRGQ